MKKQKIATGAAGLMLLATSAAGLLGWYTEYQRAERLDALVADLQKKERRSAVLRIVSKQLEELAYQQRDISDEQREEAIEQRHAAEEMRRRSEVERQNALLARQEALASERQAQEALLVAEQERQTAEHQRLLAELSKRMTDTLSYTALARSLGAISSIQSQLGNDDLAGLLSYASYYFASRYKGDVFQLAVFQSLMQASESMRSWSRHRGSLMSLAYIGGDANNIITVSSYGEIAIHQKTGDKLKSTTLFSDSSFDFRQVYVDEKKTIYAVSRSGHLVVVSGQTPKIIPIPNLDTPSYISSLDASSLLLIGDHGLAVYDRQRGMVVATRELDFKITVASRYDSMPLLFDDSGRQHLVKNINELETTPAPVQGQVTAFASSHNTKTRVYGLSDGTIYLFDEKTGKTTKLQGHLSRISKLKQNGHRLFSSSYDGTVKLWNINSSKIEPMTLISAGSWIMDFTFDSSKQFAWIGDYNGSVIEALLSPTMMAQIVKSNLKRNFTHEEWIYFVGRNVPYVAFMPEPGKEDGQ